MGTLLRSPKRITVDVNKDVNITVGAGARDAARIIVTNHGASAVSIRSIGLTVLDGSRAVDYERSKTGKAALPEGPDLPAKVEPN